MAEAGEGEGLKMNDNDLKRLVEMRDMAEQMFRTLSQIQSEKVLDILVSMAEIHEERITQNFAMVRHHFPLSGNVKVPLIFTERTFGSISEGAAELAREILLLISHAESIEKIPQAIAGLEEAYETLSHFVVLEVNKILRGDEDKTPADDRYEFCRNFTEFAKHMGVSKSAVTKWNKKQDQGDTDYSFYQRLENGSIRIDKKHLGYQMNLHQES